jgi:hypothetical protein
MSKRKYFFAAVFSLTALNGVPAFAQDQDVDQADSLDFQSFHTDKKAAVKVWKEGATDATKNAPVKTYEQTPTSATTSAPAAATPTVTPTATAKTAAATTASSEKSIPASAAIKEGQRYEIRERYTLTRSTKTPYSAFYVIEPLYKQSAQLCVRGWKKLSERSEPIEQDFYLYYEIECL